MNFDEVISTLAFGLSFVEIIKQVETAKFVDVEKKGVVIVGLISSCLWFTYQYRKLGTNATTVFTGVGIVVQYYILNEILLKERKRLKDSE